MRPGTKLAAFALVLAVSFGLGAAIGAAAGPIDVDGPDHDAPVETTVVEMPADHEGH